MNAQQNAYVLPLELHHVLAVERISVSPTGEQPGQGADFYAFVFDLGQEDAVSAFGATPSEAVANVLSLLGKPFVVAEDEELNSGAAVIELSKVEQMAAYYDAPKGFFDWIDTMRGRASS